MIGIPSSAAVGLHSVCASASAASFKIASINGLGTKEFQAVGMVMCRAELAARHFEGDLKMRTTTSHRRRSTFVSQTSVVPGVRQSAPTNLRITEEEVAAKFAAVVTPYSKNDLSAISGRSTEAAKHWKSASRAPNSSSLITIARQVGVVRAWLISEIDVPEAAQADGPDALATVMVGLQMAANLPGQQGAMARALLAKMHQGDG